MFKILFLHVPQTYLFTLHTLTYIVFDFFNIVFLYSSLSCPLFNVSTFSMEFQYRDGQNQRTPLAMPFSGVAYFSGNPLEGNTLYFFFMFLSTFNRPICFAIFYMKTTFPNIYSFVGYEFMPGGFPDNVPTPNVFPTTMLINAEEAFRQELVKKQIRREREEEEIRKKIISRETTLAHRRELEEEVKREMMSERMGGIPMQRTEGFLFPDRVYVNLESSYQRMMNHVNHINIFGRPQPQLPGQVDTRQPYTLTNTEKDKVIILVSV